MKKKLYILGLVVILGLGGAYAIAGNSDTKCPESGSTEPRKVLQRTCLSTGRSLGRSSERSDLPVHV